MLVFQCKHGPVRNLILCPSQECLQSLRIIRTNGINVDDEGKMTAVYKEFSRINHSCAPSAVRNIQPDTGAISVVAARRLEKGEEITIKVTLSVSSYVQ